MEAQFRDLVRQEQRRDGRTVLLSSHILAEVEALCDRVTIIRDGRTVEAGTLAELRHLKRTVVVADLAPSADVTAIAADLAAVAGVHGLTTDGDRISFETDADALSTAMARLSSAGLRGLVSTPPTLEELFLRHYDHAGTIPAGAEPTVTATR
jgi:ABC-2 type transport system ATP-binding protein